MKKSIIFFLFLVFLASNTGVFAQYGDEFEMYPNYPDTLYLLPGESCDLQFGLKPSGDIWVAKSKIIALRAEWQHNMFLQKMDNISIYWQTQDLKEGTPYKLYGGTVFLNQNPGHHVYSWLADSTKGIDFLWLMCFSFDNNMPISESVSHWLHVHTVTQDTNSHYDIATNVFKSIDGIRGDVDRNGVADRLDVSIMATFSLSDKANYRYNKYGINLGLGAILFGDPCLFDAYLLNLFINDPNNPLLDKWMIGQPMSSRTSHPMMASFDSSSFGNMIYVASEGNLVQVTAYMPNGEIVVETKMSDSGNFIFEFLDKPLKFKIESVNLEGVSTTDVENYNDGDVKSQPNSFQLHQNYPNPFNPTTTISFDLPKADKVSLKILNLRGQVVANLVNSGLSAGSHQVQWNASDLPSG
ncbi:T9SS type A sorting domain-containing protein, partial [Patescibacteria group bacterium]|nr:T9SS type A sorting domain-containing protein [Patescibacteria group bacterium]